MPVTGHYMAQRVRHSAVPYVKTYDEWIRRDFLPTFSDLENKASQIADAEYQHLGSLPVGEDWNGDMSSAAEAAQDKGQAFYATIVAIRQTTLNLFSAGLFHLIEQQLASLCRDGAIEAEPPRDTKLEVVTDWYKQHFKLDLSALPAWQKIDELRLVANAVKHAEGSSAKQLRERCPELFQEPNLRELLPDFPQMYTSSRLCLPLAGEDIYVTEARFAEYRQAALAFATQIAEFFDAHAEEHYLAVN